MIVRPPPTPEILRQAREMHSKGYTHDCYEWVDAGCCQICGRDIEHTAMSGMPRDILQQMITSDLDEAVRLAFEIRNQMAAMEGSVNRAQLAMRAIRQQDDVDQEDRQRGDPRR